MNLALPLRPIVSRADSALFPGRLGPLPTQIVERNDACDAGLIIDGVVVCVGRVPTSDGVEAWLGVS